MTDITRLTQEMKAAAEKAKHAGEAPVMPFDTRISALNEYQLTVCPDNVLALVEALQFKEEQRANWFQMAQKLGEDLDAAEKRNAESESSGIAPGILRCSECSFVETKNIISVTADTITTGNSEPEPCPNGCGRLQPVTWKALAIQLMFTTKQGVSDLLEAKKRIAELEEAEQKLCAANVTLDARAELAERRLAEMESRTVKLPDDAEHDIMAPVAAYLSEKFKWDGRAVRWDGRNEYDALADRVKYALRMVIRRAAGIKWEAE
ncbi:MULTISPECIES: hypothetical protein [Klebsiella]|uniref:hypothetical protein n=1 Tax=Klebsiella TaxID=570 RepID=UPI001CB80B44|nr:MULTISPECIES: hypothetical protein [Klebsiella]